MTDHRPRCDKCNRRVKPRWKYYDSQGGIPVYVGPTCRKKLIAGGVPESAFELVAVFQVKK